MKRLFPVVAAAAAVLGLGGCSDQSEEVRKLERQVAHQQDELDRANEDISTLRGDLAGLKTRLGGPRAAGDEQPSLREELDTLHKSMEALGDSAEEDDLRSRVEDVEKRLDGVREEAVSAAREEAVETARDEAARHAAEAAGVDEERIAALAAEKLAQEAEANKPTKNFDEAMDRLDISDAEKQAIRNRVLQAKQEIVELLEIPTNTGRNFADDLIDTFIKIQMGEAEQGEFIALYHDLTTTQIPGDPQGRTYARAIDEVKKLNHDDIALMLSEEDQEKLTKAHEDWSDFEVGEGDPFGALYMDRLDAYQREKEASGD